MVSELMYLKNGGGNSVLSAPTFPTSMVTCPIHVKGKLTYITWSNEEETLLRSLIASK